MGLLCVFSFFQSIFKVCIIFNNMKKVMLLFVFLLIISFVVSFSGAINFTLPTPASEIKQTETNVEINISITEEDINEVEYNWNGTNYTMYNDSLVLMMNFDNVSALGENSTYVVDLSGNENNGSGNGFDGDEIVSGKYGSGVSFDGNNDYIEIPDSDSLNISNSISVGFWLKSGVPSSDSQIIIAKPASSSNYIGDWWFEASSTNSRLSFYLKESDGTNRDLNVDTVLDDSWHYVLGTYNGTTQSIYIDGSLNSTISWTGTLLNFNQPIYIGKAMAVGDYGDEFFDGALDELRIWNRGLSAEEVYQQYVSNLNKFNSTQWYLYVNQSKNATTGLDYGSYTYQTFTTNNSEYTNLTEQRTVTIKSDIINPELNVSNITTNEGSSFGVLFNASDLSNLSYWWVNDTNFKINQSGYFENNSVLTDGNYYVNVSVNDTLNNIVSEVIIITVIAITTEEDSSSSTSSPPSVQMGTVDSVGFSGELRYGYTGNFRVKNENHRIYLRGIDREKGIVNFDVYSELQKIEVKVGEGEEVDLDGDGVMDIFLKVNSIDDVLMAVDLELGEVGEIVADDIVAVNEGLLDEDEGMDDFVEVERNFSWIWVFVLLIGIAAAKYCFWKKK